MVATSCPFCGIFGAGVGSFCQHCGKPLRATAQQRSGSSNRSQAIALWVIAITVVIAGIFFIVRQFFFIKVTRGIVAEHQAKVSIAAYEATAISKLVTVGTAQSTFQRSYGRFGTLEELIQAGYLKSDIAEKDGYKIKTRAVTKDEFEAVAVPIEYGLTGRRSLYTNQTFVIRYSDRGGLEATVNDPAF